MPLKPAIRFEHHAGFVDFVRQHSDDKGAPYSLHACTEPQGLGHVYFLTRQGDAGWLRKATRRGWSKVKIDVDKATGQLRQTDGTQPHTYLMEASRTEAELPLLAGPVPVNDDRTPDMVVLWCTNEETFQRLIGMSLRLGCDRLQYATVSQEGQEPVFLLRGERLSYYVIDVAREDAHTKVYRPLADGSVYVELGMTHPLLELLIGADSQRGALFIEGERVEAVNRRVSMPSWKDIYRLTRFELADVSSDEDWAEAKGEPNAFSVPLRLTPAHAQRDPYLWLLRQDEQSRVEQLLKAIPEPDLDSLQFTAQDAPDGSRYLLIRERHTGIGREYIDFEGIQLGPYAGYPNLMLPIDQELEPQLRKDRYRELFKLRPGHLTLLWGKDKLNLVHLRESSFQPLRSFVNYIIGTEGQDLQEVIGRTVFSFQDYRFARAAHAPRPKPKADIKTPERPDVEWDALPDEDGQTEQVVKKKKRKDEPIKVPRPAKPEAPSYTELESKELTIEGELILKGQSAERWTALGLVKEAMGKHQEATVCWMEALWLTQDAESRQRLEERVLRSLGMTEDFKLRGNNATERARHLQEQAFKADSAPFWTWLWVTHGARHLEGNPNDQLAHAYLADGHRLLGERKNKLRKKERWMLWRRLITLNQDKVEEARVREELLEELNQRGLRPQDIPQFIQNRIYQSRLIDDSDVDGGSEARAAMRILERIQEEVGRAEDDTLRVICDAVLAYGFERLGDRARAAQHASSAERAFQKPLNTAGSLTGIERAWVALYLGAANEVAQENSGAEWLAHFERLFRQNKTGDLYSSELETLQKHLLERAGAESPTKFLDAENFRSLYPSPQKYTRGQAIRHELEGMVQRGEFDKTLQTLQDLANRAAKGQSALNLDTREMAWLLHQVVIKTMRRIGRAAEGGPILEKFEQGRIDPSEDTMGGFYPTLYMIALGEGFLDLGEEQRGMDLVCGAVRGSWHPAPRLQWLDHLDMLSAGLSAIELAPLEHRIDAVSEVLQALFLDRKHRSDRPQYRPIKLRLLDHCLEVGLSKEKLSLKRYKNYMEEDEFHVRQRIIRERLT
mgnify:CR=1 FL=1